MQKKGLFINYANPLGVLVLMGNAISQYETVTYTGEGLSINYVNPLGRGLVLTGNAIYAGKGLSINYVTLL